ncbi:thiolase family protein [Christensenella timonensis]|uniref:thiolase family protein n=1 Tax=Christensenella timonensis TaxID=1816678 RepID=UPI00082D19B5|nr:thiolase family protein [Christensenella timonensis]
MKDIVIIDGARTAIGSFGGSLKDFPVTDLGAIVIEEALKRSGVKKEDVDEVVMGCVGQVAEDAFMARRCAIKAGIPATTSTAYTVNRLCSSGLQAIVTGAMAIEAEDAEIVVAGGAESMNNLPYYVRKARFGLRMGDSVLEDGLVTSLTDPFSGKHMGITAENVAEKYHISRKDQDQFALESQQKAAKAVADGVFRDEIVPVTVKRKKEEFVFDTDEHIRANTTLEKLASLRPAFKEGGTVTAGNASGINDGAGAVVMMTAEKAEEMGLEPKLRLVAYAAAGVEPSLMGTGPIPSVKKALKRAGLNIGDMDIIELNEAFAAQALCCIRELGMDVSKVNPHGGAIAMGHPIGGTGAILTVKLMYDMMKSGAKYGMETLCIGGGQGLTMIYERI